ncbi:MAG: hypothetical protein ABFE01_15965, partial [Phycisphaerales bacterium]
NDESNESNNTAFNPSSTLTVVAASKPVLYVDSSAHGADNGSSWNNAFSSLQDALAKASAGCEIRIADGVYAPDQGTGMLPRDRRATFALKQGVTLRGGYAGTGATDPDARAPDTFATILSGDLNGDDAAVEDASQLGADLSRTDNSLHVVTIADADRTTVLDGVRIMSGRADGTSGDSRGGGIRISGGSPRLQACQFFGNWAAVGGGAIHSSEGNPELIGCTLCGNACGSGPIDTTAAGGAVFVDGGSPVLANCSLHGNFTSGSGGAIVLAPDGVLAAVNCSLHANGAAVQGGAIYALDSQATLADCTLADNDRDGTEDAIVCESSGIDGQGKLSIANSILWGRGRQFYGPGGSLIAVACCDVRGSSPGVGNLDINPLFVSPNGPDGLAGTSDDNLRLCRDSPCIDAGKVDALPEDILDLDGDGDTEEPLPLDHDGHSRIVDKTVDLGAYESSDSNDEPSPGGC